jgi:hypothetical protein
MATAFVVFMLAAQPTFAATKFGANLSGGPWFVSNAYPGQLCDHELNGGSGTESCTWILNQAFNGGSATAPVSGTINKVKIISGKAGSFKLVLAQKSGSNFKVVSRSATVSYSTDPCTNSGGCTVRKFSISPMSVKAGYYVGIQTNKTSMLRCDSGGARTYLFTPPLAPGGGYTAPSGSTGCYLLLQVVYS